MPAFDAGLTCPAGLEPIEINPGGWTDQLLRAPTAVDQDIGPGNKSSLLRAEI